MTSSVTSEARPSDNRPDDVSDDGGIEGLRLPSWRGARRSATGTRRRSSALLAALTIVALAMGVTSAVLWKRADSRETITAARVGALAEASSRLPDLLSYSHATLEADLARANTNTTGPFHDDYAKVLSDVVMPNATAQETTTKVDVNDAAVVSASEDHVVVLAFLTQTTVSGAGAPVLTGSRVEVTLDHVEGHWLISGLLPL